MIYGKKEMVINSTNINKTNNYCSQQISEYIKHHDYVDGNPSPDFRETQKYDGVNPTNETVIFSLLTIENNQKATQIRFHSVTLDNITKRWMATLTWIYIQYTYIVGNITFILTSLK